MNPASETFYPWPGGRARWELLGPGAALVAYGSFFRDDLGWAFYGLIGLSIFVVTVGRTAYAWSQQGLERWSDWLEAEPRCLSPQLALERAWRGFRWSLAAMSALGAFSLWRVQMTVWLIDVSRREIPTHDLRPEHPG